MLRTAVALALAVAASASAADYRTAVEALQPKNRVVGSADSAVVRIGLRVTSSPHRVGKIFDESGELALEPGVLGYEGHQFDNETSLTYARARYLDNRYGVLLSRDPVEGTINDAPSLHRYTWARGGPLRFLDFTGLVEGESVEDQRARIMQMREAEARASRSGFATVAPAEFDPDRVEKDRWYRYLDADLSKADRPMSALELRERQIAQGHARQAEYSLVYGKKVAEKVATEAVFLVGVETGLYFVGRAAPALLRTVVEAGRTEASLARVEGSLARLEAVDAASGALRERVLANLSETRTATQASRYAEYLADEAGQSQSLSLANEATRGQPIDPVAFERMKAAFERQGGRILQGPEVERYLDWRGVEAVTDNAKQILLRATPTRSAVFEEFMHTAQHRAGKVNDLIGKYGNQEAERQLEIEVSERLVHNRKAWDIPNDETRQTIDRLRKLRGEGD